MRSGMVRDEVHPLSSFSSPLKSFMSETVPFNSPDSKRLTGYIFILDILPVPVWYVFTFFEVEPVSIKCPLAGLSSQYERTASHSGGASCHSSINLGCSLPGVPED